MNQYFFRVPFAVSGDVLEIPQALQPSGQVSFTQGYTFDYERVLDYDPDAKAIERDKQNFLFGAITAALKQYQTFGVPEFITSTDNGGTPYAYAKGATVRYTGDGGTTWEVYESQEDNNEDEPPSSKWRRRSAWSANLVANNGYFWHESGFIVQWGRQSGINALNTRTVSLPVTVDLHFGGHANVLNSNPSFTMNYTAFSASQFRLYNGSGGERNCFWTSFGYKAIS